MANKREFKKYVDAVGASACEAMMATYYNCEGVDQDAVEKAMSKVLAAVGTARAHSNVKFDKGVKAFADSKEYKKAKEEFSDKVFNKINNDFAAQLDEALKIFNAAIPQKEKDANKKAVTE